MKRPFCETVAVSLGWSVREITLCQTSRRGKIINRIGNSLKALRVPYMFRYDAEQNVIAVAGSGLIMMALDEITG